MSLGVFFPAPSLRWLDTSLPGVGSEQHGVSWGSTGVQSGKGMQGNCEEKLGGGGQFQTSGCTGDAAS